MPKHSKNLKEQTLSDEIKHLFDSLPSEVKKQIFQALDFEDKISLARTSKAHSRLFKNTIYASKLLQYIVQGQRQAADIMLSAHPSLVAETGDVIDNSARHFTNITAYDYAKWAKDVHSCRMLESHLTSDTMNKIVNRIEKNHQGLTFYQQGEVKNSSYYDLVSYRQLLQDYADNMDFWSAHGLDNERKRALEAIEEAQLDLPVHVVQEYSRRDRPFNASADFGGADFLPEEFYGYYSSRRKFPLHAKVGLSLFADALGGLIGVTGALFVALPFRAMHHMFGSDVVLATTADTIALGGLLAGAVVTQAAILYLSCKASHHNPSIRVRGTNEFWEETTTPKKIDIQHDLAVLEKMDEVKTKLILQLVEDLQNKIEDQKQDQALEAGAVAAGSAEAEGKIRIDWSQNLVWALNKSKFKIRPNFKVLFCTLGPMTEPNQSLIARGGNDTSN